MPQHIAESLRLSRQPKIGFHEAPPPDSPRGGITSRRDQQKEGSPERQSLSAVCCGGAASSNFPFFRDEAESMRHNADNDVALACQPFTLLDWRAWQRAEALHRDDFSRQAKERVIGYLAVGVKVLCGGREENLHESSQNWKCV